MPSIVTARAAVSLSFDAGMFELLGQSLLYAIGHVPGRASAMARDRFLSLDDVPPAGAGSAESRLHRPADGHLVGFGWPRSADLRRAARPSVQPGRHCRAGLSVMDDPALDRRAISAPTVSRCRSPSTAARSIYIGWYLLLVISAITIVGWAWVVVAQTRWICRNIGGTHREILFKATGLEMLWRTLVFGHRLRLHHPDPLDDCAGICNGWSRNSNWLIAAHSASAAKASTSVRAASLPARRKPPACRPA